MFWKEREGWLQQQMRVTGAADKQWTPRTVADRENRITLCFCPDPVEN